MLGTYPNIFYKNAVFITHVSLKKKFPFNLYLNVIFMVIYVLNGQVWHSS